MSQPSPEIHLTVRLNPAGIIAPLHRILSESLNNVALGLQAVEQYQTAVSPLLPTNLFHVGFGQVRAELSETELAELKAKYRTWLLTTAFGDFIQAVFAALREAYLYCEAATTWTDFVSLEEMQGFIQGIASKGAKFDLPTLLERVSKRLKAPLALHEHVLAINKVRNCLEHRHGIVTKLDLNDPANNCLVSERGGELRFSMKRTEWRSRLGPDQSSKAQQRSRSDSKT